ncbi:MAG: ComEC/Rec2 family competence protein [Rhizobiales bacterium]|nr:ComEC/Rec2 family competence protein [Hyphomicrobiales bacterium]
MIRRPRPATLVLPSGLGWRQFEPFSALSAMISGWIEQERAARTGFLLLPVLFALGILLYFSARTEPSLWAGAGLTIILVLSAMRWRRPRPILIGLAFLAAGFAAATWRTAWVASPMLERAGLYRVSGFVEAVDATQRRQRITLRVTGTEDARGQAMPYRLRIGAPGPAQFAAGNHVVLRARLSPPSEPAMPGGYDFRRESFFRAVGGVGYAIGRIESQPTQIRPDFSLRFNAAVDRWRNSLTERIARAIGGEEGALAAALVTGKRGLISNETNDDLRGSGLYHIVSISGLHMVMAAGVMFWSLRALLALFPSIALRYPIKKWAAAGAMLGATAYCIFSGSEVATERSLIMTLVMLGAILVDRPALAMRNVAISALIVLAREPESLLGPSFQMSYAAVAALIAGNALWRRYRPEREATEGPHGIIQSGFLARAVPVLLLAFGGILATTILASLATAPFSAYHFHRLNPYGLIGNALAIPLVSLVVMPCAVIGTLLVPFGLDGPVWAIMGEGMRGVLFVAAKVASLEGAAPPVARMPAYLFGMLVIALIMLVMLSSALRFLSIPILILWAILVRTAPLPDLMIAPDGRMALFRAESGRYALLSPGTPSSFTLQQWLPSIGDPRLPADPSLKQGTRCDRSGCTGRTASGQRISLSLNPESVRQDCQRSGLIITPWRFPTEACSASATLVAEDTHRRYGAQRIMLDGSRIAARETSLDPNRPRPWRRVQPPEPAINDPAAPDPIVQSPTFRRGEVPGLPEEEPGLLPPASQ